MTKLNSLEWQNNCIRYSGRAYTSPSDVRKELEDLVHTLAVFGHINSAERLQKYANSDLCKTYAPLIAVLCELSEFSPRSDEIELCSHEYSDQLSDFKLDTDDPNDGISELSDNGEYDCAESQSGKNQVPDYHGPTTRGKNSNYQNIVGFAHLKTSDFYAYKSSLTNEEFIDALFVYLHGYPCDFFKSDELGLKCSSSLWKHFTSVQAEISNIQCQHTKLEVLSAIRNMNCRTVLQLVTCCERVINSVTKPKIEGIGYLNKWIKGDFILPFEVTFPNAELLPATVNSKAVIRKWISGGTQFDDLVFKCFRISPELHHPELYNVVLYASVLYQCFNVQPLVHPLTWEGDQAYNKLLHELSWTLKDRILITYGIKDEILRAWDIISAVYLAQDPKVLLFLDMWLGKDSERRDVSDHNAVLKKLQSAWGSKKPPFTLSHSFTPVLVPNIRMHWYIQKWLGKNYSVIFPPEKLDIYWHRVVFAFRDGDQSVELELRSVATSIKKLLIKDCLSPPMS